MTAVDAWQWKTENVNGSGSAACNMNTSGVHIVYTILNEPVVTDQAGEPGRGTREEGTRDREPGTREPGTALKY